MSPVVNKFYIQIFERFSTRRTNEEEQPPRGSREKARARGRKEGRNVSSRRGRSGAQTRRGVPKSAPRPRPTRRSISTHSWGKRWKRTRTSSTRSTRTNDICSNTDTRRKQRKPSKRWKDCCRGRRWEKETRRKAPRKRKMSNVGCPSLLTKRALIDEKVNEERRREVEEHDEVDRLNQRTRSRSTTKTRKLLLHHLLSRTVLLRTKKKKKKKEKRYSKVSPKTKRRTKRQPFALRKQRMTRKRTRTKTH